MNAIELILLLLSCFGMTLILVHGKIMDIPRDFLSNKFVFFKKLIHCSMCTGWWVGLFFAFIWTLHITFPVFFYFVTIPFASSGISFLLERIAIFIDDRIIEDSEEQKVENWCVVDEGAEIITK